MKHQLHIDLHWSCRHRTLTKKYLAIDYLLFTPVLIAMNYFFRCQKSASNLENNKCICQVNVSIYHVTGSTYSRIIFRAMYTYVSELPILLNLYISKFHGSLYKEIKLELSKLENNSFSWKVNFSIIHPTHVPIYNF